MGKLTRLVNEYELLADPQKHYRPKLEIKERHEFEFEEVDFDGEFSLSRSFEPIRKFLTEKIQIQKESDEFLWLFAFYNNQLVAVFKCAQGRGSVNTSVQAIFTRLLQVNATGFILAHNHPNVEARPSRNDVKTFNKWREIGDFIGVRLFDNIIFSWNKDNIYSFTVHAEEIMERFPDLFPNRAKQPAKENNP